MADLIAWWAATYRGNDLIQLGSALGHILSVAYAARYALNGDRAALRLTSGSVARRPPALQLRDLETIARAHQHVIGGLAFAFATGIAQLLAQLSYLGSSPIFWIKMVLLTSLLINGWLIRGVGRGLLSGGASLEDPRSSRMLRGSALRSAVLWCVLVVMGLLLTTVRPS